MKNDYIDLVAVRLFSKTDLFQAPAGSGISAGDEVSVITENGPKDMGIVKAIYPYISLSDTKLPFILKLMDQSLPLPKIYEHVIYKMMEYPDEGIEMIEFTVEGEHEEDS